ncbi:TPA: hypothetical protein N0F65_004996 [Lagenidium giganteum]|uniref:Uncharacterized protein n=1 Tax=Lagenidium giganteum TaxID=4803 RepID=A0AAV2ZGY7_9STRA|nr:TPA: hypothetical protein N0F65_004996 [Lagenidium giganteum]
MLSGYTRRAKRLRRCWRHAELNDVDLCKCLWNDADVDACRVHGRGIACSLQDCQRIAISNGFCWSRGGGKRCKIPGCSRAAYRRTRD